MPEFTEDSSASEVAAVFSTNIAKKVILITGCSPNGLGATAAEVIARHNPGLIILAGRTRSLIEETEKTILAKSPDAKTRILIFDLASLKSVREAAAEVNKYEESIDIVINNAAIMANPFEKTVDGFESQFATNHLGPFLFTNLITGKLTTSSGGRIINISSEGYKISGVRFEDPNFETGYDRWQSYGQSKTANILFAEALAERLGPKGIFSYSVHVGGGIMTNLGKHMQPVDYENLSWVKIITHDQGAASYIAGAFDPRLEASNGSYLAFCKPVSTKEMTEWAYGKEKADRLWALSEKLVGETFDY